LPNLRKRTGIVKHNKKTKANEDSAKTVEYAAPAFSDSFILCLPENKRKSDDIRDFIVDPKSTATS
jgi:hypothetical protein